jgi:hypothetical protein
MARQLAKNFVDRYKERGERERERERDREGSDYY